MDMRGTISQSGAVIYSSSVKGIRHFTVGSQPGVNSG